LEKVFKVVKYLSKIFTLYFAKFLMVLLTNIWMGNWNLKSRMAVWYPDVMFRVDSETVLCNIVYAC